MALTTSIAAAATAMRGRGPERTPGACLLRKHFRLLLLLLLPSSGASRIPAPGTMIQSPCRGKRDAGVPGVAPPGGEKDTEICVCVCTRGCVHACVCPRLAQGEQKPLSASKRPRRAGSWSTTRCFPPKQRTEQPPCPRARPTLVAGKGHHRLLGKARMDSSTGQPGARFIY